MLHSIQELKSYIDYYESMHGHLNAIVVEGYDGVGKGKILEQLSEEYQIKPYRPDYSMWQQYDHRKKDRWKVSGFFWDIYSHFFSEYADLPMMLFDRGVMSGAVYGDDLRIAQDYKKLLRGCKVLHVLVVCSEIDYVRFAEVRHSKYQPSYEDCRHYTEAYIECFEEAGVDYVLYMNRYSQDESTSLSKTCGGCGHYSYGKCSHPEVEHNLVSKDDPRCKYSYDMEVQDIVDVGSMQLV